MRDQRPRAAAPASSWAEIVPVSAVTGDQVDAAGRPARRAAARGPAAVPRRRAHRRARGDPGRRADPRGGARGVRDELPHSIAVVVEEMGLRPTGRRQAAARRPGEPLRRARQPEGHRHRPPGRPAQGRRHGRAQADRSAARHAGLPRPAGQGGQGLAARPQAAAPARLLTPASGRVVPASGRVVPASGSRSSRHRSRCCRQAVTFFSLTWAGPALSRRGGTALAGGVRSAVVRHDPTGWWRWPQDAGSLGSAVWFIADSATVRHRGQCSDPRSDTSTPERAARRTFAQASGIGDTSCALSNKRPPPLIVSPFVCQASSLRRSA